jgi:1-deoxy-D-xylulose-5-phosphate synthase
VDIKTRADTMLRRLPLGDEISEALRHLKDGLRASLHGEQLFEALGFRYFGPVDGHDVNLLLRTLRAVSGIQQPVLLHVHTQKGKGCDYAVEDPCRFHSPSAHKVNGGVVEFPPQPRPSWTKAFSGALLDAARRDQRVVAITAAMPDGTGLAAFRDQFSQRYIDVGINESHAVAMAAGLAKAGLRPVVAIYSTFLQRSFDQVFEEVSLQKLPVTFCLDRAGLCGSDGAVHHGFCDISLLRTLPRMVLMAPADEVELRGALELALSLDVPSAIRYPRDETPPPLPHTADQPFLLGKACQVRAGADGAFLALGAMAEHALAAAKLLAGRQGVEIAVYSARFAKPLDEPLIAELARTGRCVLCVEDHALAGGFGSAVVESAVRAGLDVANFRLLGLPDRFVPHATRDEQLAQAGLDVHGLASAMLAAIAERRLASLEKPSSTLDLGAAPPPQSPPRQTSLSDGAWLGRAEFPK